MLPRPHTVWLWCVVNCGIWHAIHHREGKISMDSRVLGRPRCTALLLKLMNHVTRCRSAANTAQIFHCESLRSAGVHADRSADLLLECGNDSGPPIRWSIHPHTRSLHLSTSYLWHVAVLAISFQWRTSYRWNSILTFGLDSALGWRARQLNHCSDLRVPVWQTDGWICYYTDYYLFIYWI